MKRVVFRPRDFEVMVEVEALHEEGERRPS